MKARSASVSNLLCKIFAVLFTVLFFWAFLTAVTQTALYDYYLPFALAPLLMLLLLLLWKRVRAFYHRIPADALVRVFAIACLVSFSAMLYTSYRLRLTFGVDTWDFSRLHIDAYNSATQEAGVNLLYYVKYKNNQLLLFVLSLLAEAVRWLAPGASSGVFHQCAMALNCVSILTAVVLCFCSVKAARGAHFAFLSGMFLLFYTPLWLYSPIYYTDTMGLPLIVLPVFLYTRLKDGKLLRNTLLFCLMGVVAAIGMKMKASIVFVFIAICLCTLLLDRMRGKWIPALCGTVVLALCAVLLQAGIDRALRIDAEDYDAYGFPYSHWVMMSLGNNGGYDAELVTYTGSFYTMEERKEAVREKTKELLEARGFAGTAKHVFVTKMQHTWGNGSLSATYYLGREPAENGVFQRFFTQKGALFRGTFTWLQTGHLVLLFCVVLSGVSLFRRPEGGPLTVMRITVLGLLLFLLVWECNARYLVHIAPCLVTVAADGISALGRRPDRQN